MARLPLAVERETEYNVAYVRYREHEPKRVGRTIGYADHQINVDVDETNEIVGIEILALSADELTALANIARAYDLDLSPLISGAVPNAA
jgi:uncharacterized protein YuzE